MSVGITITGALARACGEIAALRPDASLHVAFVEGSAQEEWRVTTDDARSLRHYVANDETGEWREWFLGPKLRIGDRVALVWDVDRYPHFIAPQGGKGTVVQADDDVVSVKLDAYLPGAEEWENEVNWYPSNGDEPRLDLRRLESGAELLAEKRMADAREVYADYFGGMD